MILDFIDLSSDDDKVVAQYVDLTSDEDDFEGEHLAYGQGDAAQGITFLKQEFVADDGQAEAAQGTATLQVQSTLPIIYSKFLYSICALGSIGLSIICSKFLHHYYPTLPTPSSHAHTSAACAMQTW